MATKTITTYEHSCDLCGEIRDEAELAHLSAPRPSQYAGGAQLYDRMDICANCRNRPIDDALEFFRAKQQEDAVPYKAVRVTKVTQD